MTTLEKQPSAFPAPLSPERTLAHYPFPPGFAERLKKENRWTERQVTLVLTEYRRFLILATQARVTPSQVVDRAWHLHLTYTRDYWERLMPLLPAPLHHDPAGDGEKAEMARQYLDTLDLYHAHFGVRPHPGIWPDPRRPVKRAGAGCLGLFFLVPVLLLVSLFVQAVGGAHLIPWLWGAALIGAALWSWSRRSPGRGRSSGDTDHTGAAVAGFVLVSELDGFSGSDGDSGGSGSDGGGGDSGGSSCGGGGCGGGCGSD